MLPCPVEDQGVHLVDPNFGLPSRLSGLQLVKQCQQGKHLLIPQFHCPQGRINGQILSKIAILLNRQNWLFSTIGGSQKTKSTLNWDEFI